MTDKILVCPKCGWIWYSSEAPWSYCGADDNDDAVVFCFRCYTRAMLDLGVPVMKAKSSKTQTVALPFGESAEMQVGDEKEPTP